MDRKLATLWICSVFMIATAFGAADTDTLQQENADLKERVEKLESQVNRLVQLLESKPPAKAATVDQNLYQGLDDESLKKLAQMVAEQDNGGKKPVLSNLNMDIYGFIRLDTAYDDSSVTDGGGGSYLKWANSESTHSNDDQFTMTARASRIGVNISGPENNGLRTSGKLEIDFSGGGTETNNEVRMRQAYLNMDWKESDFSILAGQAWDVVSPLNPPTVDFGVLWWSGNLGLRRPQLRATKGYDLGNGNKMTLVGAITRNMGRTSDWDNLTETGEDDGTPQYQGRLGFILGKTKIGVSGHFGKEEYDLDGTGKNRDYDTWSANVDLVQPINDWMTVKGEAFTGENLNILAGGIGQGVNEGAAGAGDESGEIESTGGWIALCMKPYEKWTFNVGYGIDEPDDDYLSASGRTKNEAIFGNAVYAINKNTDVGFEIQNRKTEYKGLDDGDDLRFQMMFRYKF